MMNITKEIIVPLLLVFVSAAVVILAMLPLEETAWAEGFRTSFVGEEEGETAVSAEATEEDSGEPSAIFGFIASFIKITLFMGIPGLITLGILKLTNRKPKRASTA